MSTRTPVPPAPTQAGGRQPRRWWLIALIAALVIVVLAVGVFAFQLFGGPISMPGTGCNKAADPTRSGAISQYCPSGYQPGSSMIIGPDGNVWFTDSNARIARMTPQNEAVTEFAAPTAPNQVAASGLVRGTDGNIWYIANYTLGRITLSGAVSEYALPKELGLVGRIAAGPDGVLWVQTNMLLKITIPNPSDATAAPRITQVAGLPANTGGPMAVTADGSLWMVTDPTALTRITPAGSITQFTLNIPGPAPSCGSKCKGVVALTAGPDGNMWFIDGWNHIGRITPAGTTTFFPIATEGWQFTSASMGAGPDGNVWFAPTASGGGGIGRITPTGVVTKYSLPQSGVNASNISAGSDGGVWFLSWYSGGAFQSPQGRITRITP